MASPPLVSILINNHNYGRYLRAAIDSALRQTYPHTEVIVVDDGSTDDSRSVMADFGDRITSIFKTQGGQASALNAGFAASRGDYLCLLDSDDVFMADKAQRIVDRFRDNPKARWVYHEMDYIDADGVPLPLDRFPDQSDIDTLHERRAHYGDGRPVDFRDMLRSGRRLEYACPALSALSFRRSALGAVMPVPESIASASDEFPKIAALALFAGLHLGTVLAHQRIHGNNAVTGRTDGQLESALRYLNTAYHLRSRFAQVAPTTDSWFARSLGELIGAGGLRRAMAHTEGRLYIARFFGLQTWLRQGPRIAFHALRTRGAQMRNGHIHA